MWDWKGVYDICFSKVEHAAAGTARSWWFPTLDLKYIEIIQGDQFYPFDCRKELSASQLTNSGTKYGLSQLVKENIETVVITWYLDSVETREMLFLLNPQIDTLSIFVFLITVVHLLVHFPTLFMHFATTGLCGGQSETNSNPESRVFFQLSVGRVHDQLLNIYCTANSYQYF